MIGVKCDGRISIEDPHILPIGRIHMEITAQRHISFCGRNMYAFCDRPSRTIRYAILSFKAHPGRNRRHRLIAG
jgi:hypothetical protein